MTQETNENGSDLIVLGRDEAGKPQAARFPAGHNDLVTVLQPGFETLGWAYSGGQL
jgi:hypothetical protein